MIDRITPDIGYLSPAMFAELGISQVVVAGGMAHWSGIVAAQSDAAGIRFPATDVAGQLAFILDKLDLTLAAAGTDRTRIVTMTVYATAIDELSAALGGVYVPWIGEHRPALTCVGVARLSLPQTLVEVAGCALVG